jgi:hypothetical protein
MENSQVKRETANTSAVLTPASFKLEEQSKLRGVSIFKQKFNNTCSDLLM